MGYFFSRYRGIPELRGVVGLHAGAIREGQLLPGETDIA